MSEKYKIRDHEVLYFVTFSVVNWIDVFTRTLYKDILLESLRYCQQQKGLRTHAWCIMSNHVHFIFSTQQGKELPNIIRDFKKYTSSKIIESIQNNPEESRKEWMLWMFTRAGKKNINNTHYQFWQQSYHPIALYNNKMMEQKLAYIHDNPVKAGIVLVAEEYLYSSAKSYAGSVDVLLKIDLIE
ncbi:REP-associated tyrosine transposase [Solitalea koreensis]|uniref:REP element-mobilizing transposase RayT n=1 Tax=Solitalea koreensis TaxID=543615 RepID=A0A521DIA3_9SPHI|nr:transposase [Solitalea koreensis]SMO71439.1 REP element-mobilizing transposase RayT [Solitalea koreensis]